MSMQIVPGRSLGFLTLGTSLHDVLTRLKASPYLYPHLDISYSLLEPTFAPVTLNLARNGLRLRFDGPDQRLRLIEVVDFGKINLSYNNVDLVKPQEVDGVAPLRPSTRSNGSGPSFRHIYNKALGPTFAGECISIPKDESSGDVYVLSYPGVAFLFPLQKGCWSPDTDFVSLLSSSAAGPARSMSIFLGVSWEDARQELFTRTCINPRSLQLSLRGKDLWPDEIDLVKVRENGLIEMLRRSSDSFHLVLNETTSQDLLAELGPPDAIYRKNDRRLSIHRTSGKRSKPHRRSYGDPPMDYDDLLSTDKSSAGTAIDASDGEEESAGALQGCKDMSAECFFNYFGHGFDVFLSYRTAADTGNGSTSSDEEDTLEETSPDRLVVTKVLLHANVPGSYPFNRYRRCRWIIAIEGTEYLDEPLTSELRFSSLSTSLQRIWQGREPNVKEENASPKCIVINRGWGDSLGSSCELLGGFEDSEAPPTKDSDNPAIIGSSGFGNTQLFGFPGLVFEVLKNDVTNHTKCKLHQVQFVDAVMMLPGTTPITRDFLLSDTPVTTISKTYLNTTIPSTRSEQVAGNGMTARSILPKSWSSTLLLPKSAFPPRALPAHRPRYLKRCTDELYASQKSRVQNSGVFILHDGPPYANGDLHVGHALNKVLKDIINRFQLSQGKIIKYVPGWDCHGLPIELKALEKQERASTNPEARQLGAIAVRNVARDLALRTVELQKEQFRKWGIMADWENAWKTMDVDYELRQLGVFSEMVSRGLIYRRFKPVYWSPSSATALAEAELEYKDDHVSWSAFVRFPLASWPQLIATRIGLEANEVSMVVWTTTPWTLPANKAVAVNFDIEYTIVKSATHGNLLVATSRVDEVEKICKEILLRNGSIRFNGSQLVGASYRNPLLGSESSNFPVLQADFVSADSGSGLVHLAPGHGMDDYKLCLQHGISPYAPLDDYGNFTEFALPTKPDLLVGKPVLDEGNKAVLDHLADLGLLVGRHKFKHKYPYDWRSKQPVIIRATEQWFADVGEIRAAALNSLQAVSFIPKSGKERLQSFIDNRSEWCISRQRAWGVPIPALYHVHTGQAILTKASISHITSIIKARGVDAWWSDSEFDPAWTPTELRQPGGETLYRRGKDTMDVWFDSGTSWTQMENSVGRKSGDTVGDGPAVVFPAADVYLEGSDQHRGWFQSSLLTHIARQNGLTAHAQAQAPFQRLITHGFTLDQAGRKMSKSIGNVISPDEIMDGTLLPPLKRNRSKNVPAAEKQIMYDANGPDALRLWVASSDYSQDVVVGQPVLKDVSNSLLKFRVTFKLLLGLLDDYEPSKYFIFDQLGFIDQLALTHLRETDSQVRKFYRDYEFYKAVNAIKKYVNIGLSAFYFESIKDIVYAEAADSKARLAAQSTLVHILNGLLCMLSPITPILVEEVWDYIPDRIKTRLAHPFERQWVEWAASEGAVDYLHPAWRNDQLASDAPYLSAANVGIKRAQEVARSLGKMGSSLQSFVLLQLGDIDSPAERHIADVFRRYDGEMEALFVTSKVEICTGLLPTHVLDAEWRQRREFQIHGKTAVAHVYAPQKAKCIRCWKYAAPLSAAAEVALCSRCEVVVDGLSKSHPKLFKNSMDSAPTIAV